MAIGKQRRTFISYSRVNKEFAIKLAKELRSDGYSIWFDQLDIPTGSRWDDQVEKALEECEIFLLILTPAAIASENVKDEIGYAIDNRKHILPLLLENCNVPFRLRRFQYVDFTTKNFDEGIESAKQLLTNLINEDTLPRIETSSVLEDKDAQEIVGTTRKEEQESSQLAAQKIEREAKAEADRKAKREADRLAKEKSERESQAKAKPVQAMPVDAKKETVLTDTAQKKPVSMGIVIGVVAIVMLIIAGIGFKALSRRESPATEAPVVSGPTIEVPTTADTATEAPFVINPTAILPTVTNAPPTDTPIPPTQAILSKFLNINFGKDTSMDVFDVAEIGLGDQKIIDRSLSDEGLIITLNGQDLFLYYFYKPFVYQDVATKLRVENLGKVNRNLVSLICRKSNNTWYEFSVTSDGLWFLYNYDESKAKRYTPISNGGSNAIKTGKNANEYEMKCVGNEISLYINGQKVKTVKNDLYSEGQVGFNISSLDLFPIEVKVSDFEISKP